MDKPLELSVKQSQTIVSILRGLADNGCSFCYSRSFKLEKCGDDTGKGFDCDGCRARTLLKELGLKTLEELRT
jgi:hypothetical protein